MLRTLPQPVATALGEAGGLLAAATSSRRREIVADNLARVVGANPPGGRSHVVRRAFVDYGRYWVDGARLEPIGTATLARRWSVEGDEQLRKELATGRGAILAVPHLGSWEVGGRWLAASGFELTVVVEPLHPPELHEWFAEQRRRLGMKVLPLGPGTGSALVAELRSGRLVALMADRDLTGDGIEVPFFGEPTRLPAGPAVLALRTGAALFPCAVYHERHGRHRAVVRPPIEAVRSGRLRDDVERVTIALARELESLIRAAPEQWHVLQPIWPGPGPETDGRRPGRERPARV